MTVSFSTSYHPRIIFDTVTKPFGIMRGNIDVSYYTTKLGIQALKMLSLVLRLLPTPLANVFTILTHVDTALDTALIFPCARGVNRKPFSLKRWLFLSACVGGIVLFAHQIALIQLGKAAFAIGSITCGLAAGGYGVSAIKHAIHGAKHAPRKNPNHPPRWVHIAHAVASVVFYIGCIVPLTPAGVLVGLGIMAAGLGVVKTMWGPWKKEEKLNLKPSLGGV